MKRFIYLLLVVLAVACQNPVIEKVEETYPDNQPKRISFFQEIKGKEIKVEEKHFHSNGKLKMTGKFLNGKREGEWKAYFDNSQLQSLGTFKNGIQTGETKVYFFNGKLRYEGQYENNKEIGHWKFFNEQGKLIKEQDF